MQQQPQHRELFVKGRSLGTSSDLTLLAPIKPGFVESLESVTYKTRIKRVLEALHGARMNAHEHAEARLLSDSVERVAAIQSVRVAVLEPEDKVLLAVSFDGSWQAYVRVLWQKVGTLLDLIFCGTEGYVVARERSFDEWLAWAQQVQVETGFFYGPEISTRDGFYYRRVECMSQHPDALAYRVPADAHTVTDPQAAGCPFHNKAALNELRAMLPSAEETVQRVVNAPRPQAPDDPRTPVVLPARMVRERMRSGLQGLAALYRLSELHRPGTPDGEILRHAAIDLLDEFVRMRDRRLIDDELADERWRFARQLDWLFPPTKVFEPALKPRLTPPLPEQQLFDEALRRDVQSGILRPYPRVSHGLVLMLAFDSCAALGAFLQTWRPLITPDSAIDPAAKPEGVVYRNLAFTPAGLRMAGLDEATLALLPEDFRQGMAARAGLLGDVRNNHPRRWRLPRRFVDLDATAEGAERVAMESVQAVMQLRCLDESEAAQAALSLSHPKHPLRTEVAQLLATAGLRLLAVQPMRRYYQDHGTGRGPVITEHFGYADGDGQPELEWRSAEANAFRRNHVPLGELLGGYPNAADQPPDPLDASQPLAVRERQRWLTNGSFLVLRKYRQYPWRLADAVAQTAQTMQQVLGPFDAKLAGYAQCSSWEELVYAKLMGRYRDGQPLVGLADEKKPNRFTYDLDPVGRACPLNAHVRRAHPRLRPGELLRPPRLMRRSMAYGPRMPAAGHPNDQADRGLVFMAYNASLGEQFEVVQRWITGGNSTGSSSGQTCPVLGVPENGQKRYFRFELSDAMGQAQVFSVALEGRVELFEEPEALTRLEWGLYLFAPSLAVLARLQSSALTAGSTPAEQQAGNDVPWRLARGRQLLLQLREIEARQGEAAAREAWKALLEDPEAIDRLDNAALWAALRTDCDGLLRTPYGVLVAERELVAVVYRDAQRRYSVCGQFERMKLSFGEIALGMEDGPTYRALSRHINSAITALDPRQVFERSVQAVRARLSQITQTAIEQAQKAGDSRFETGVDARELLDEVLAELSEDWFGLKNAPQFQRGPADWQWQAGEPPLYPGHFTALSRYIFQPHPGPLPTELGQRYGMALREAMCSFVADRRAMLAAPVDGSGHDAPLAKAIYQDPKMEGDEDLIARTMVGVLMGYNPTIIGAVLNVLREWHGQGCLSEMRQRLAGASDYASAYRALYGAMNQAARMRPMPQLGWRIALAPHRLEGASGRHGVDIQRGDKIVMAMVSGTQQSLALGERDDPHRLMFGGIRGSDADPAQDGRYPTHACPGYHAGIAAMLGSLTGLLSWLGPDESRARGDDLRPGPAPLSFVIEGAAGLDFFALLPPRPMPSVAEPPPATRGLVLAWGDSWLDFPDVGLGNLGHTDLRDNLEQLGFRVPQRFCKYSVWPETHSMAVGAADFCVDLDAYMLAAEAPRAILLSGGGNDSTGKSLGRLLLRYRAGANFMDLINHAALTRHIRGIADNYQQMFKAIHEVLARHQRGQQVCLITHGYDHPLPRGQSIGRGMRYARKWMFNPFSQVAGYPLDEPGAPPTPAGQQAAQVAAQVMAHLIDKLNEMHIAQAQAHPRWLRHADLRGTIANAEDPEVQWLDDLHPSPEAFGLLVRKVTACL